LEQSKIKEEGVLAHFTEAVRPQLRPLPDEVTLELERSLLANDNSSK